MSYYSVGQTRLCGCWFPVRTNRNWMNPIERRYLPQVELSSSTHILAVTSRTTLAQTFVNPEDKFLDEIQYTFPLYDGISVVGFTCTIGAKTIVGVVKEKQQAKVDYSEAVARGETAGLLQQLPEASDVFTTSIGNVPPKGKIHVEIVYLGELKHDAETDGSRFTIPTIMAPRYGSVSTESADALASTHTATKGGISISVDVTLEEGSIVRGIQSPSHPIAVTMGRTSTMEGDSFCTNNASATLTLGTTELDKDFIIVVLAKGTDTPRAFLEKHSTIPNQRAIMATLVPKFNVPNISPEIVFVVDRSGSMGSNIPLVVAALKIFLKSLPVGVKFNICSFGSSYAFLFDKSKTYDQSSLSEALKYLESFAADMGGTELLAPVKQTVKNRYQDLPLEVMILTDGQIWNQEELFTFVNEATNARFFSLGIGHGASSSLVEGIARAGNGFAQFVGDNERMDKRVIRMLKGALSSHIIDYTLDVTYEEESISADDDFEMVEATPSSSKTVVTELKKPAEQKPISLFDTTAPEEPTNPPAGRYDHVLDVPVPKVLQTPYKIPALFPFNRTTAYLILGPDAPQKTPKAVTLRGTSENGPLELQIPIQDAGVGETIHQLAAKKAILELEEGRGWIAEVRNDRGELLKSAYQGKWDLMVEREAVRLGVKFQVGGKWCSFVAVEKNAQGENSASPATTEVIDRSGKRAADVSSKSRPAYGFPIAAASSSPYSNHGISLFAGTAIAGTSTGGSLFGATHTPTPTQSASAGFGRTSRQPMQAPTGSSFMRCSIAPPFPTSSTEKNFSGPSGRPDSGTPLVGQSTTPVPTEPTDGSQIIAPQDADSSGTDQYACKRRSRQQQMEAQMPMQQIQAPAQVPMPMQMQQSQGLAYHPTMPSQAPSTQLAQYQSGFMSLNEQPGKYHAMATQAAAPFQVDGRMRVLPPPTRGGFTAQNINPPHNRTGLAARKSTGGMAPRKQLASSAGKVMKLAFETHAKMLDNDHGDNDKAISEVMRSTQSPQSSIEQEENLSKLPDTDKMHRIIDLQQFSGPWLISVPLLQMIGVTVEQVARILVEAHGHTHSDADAVKATALAVSWLKTRVPNEEDVWEMVVEKATAWLEGRLGGVEHANKLLGDAAKMVQA
ncbi:hypothetical protein LTS15_006867 [Exophiala xenobiotica]|nr:hypothetical protein LTS15_006867 [Exophiala xenobiotica]